MPKPTTKDEILSAAQFEREALEQFLSELSPAQMTQTGIVGEWSVKDVLAHLLEWEQMVLNWYATGRQGKTPAVPSEKYNWGQLPQLNQSIYEKHHRRDLADIQKDFKASYKKTLKTIQSLTDEELFTRGHYAWTRNNALAAYFVSCTSSHYRWAKNEIKKGMKKQEGTK
jgi:hypothetical protein